MAQEKNYRIVCKIYPTTFGKFCLVIDNLQSPGVGKLI